MSCKLISMQNVSKWQPVNLLISVAFRFATPTLSGCIQIIFAADFIMTLSRYWPPYPISGCMFAAAGRHGMLDKSRWWVQRVGLPLNRCVTIDESYTIFLARFTRVFASLVLVDEEHGSACLRLLLSIASCACILSAGGWRRWSCSYTWRHNATVVNVVNPS